MNLKDAFRQAPETALKIIQEMKDGKRETGLDWGDDIRTGKVRINEMIGTDDGSREFIEKITYDLYSGRENIPLLYKSIYTTIQDSALPKTLTAEEFGPIQVVFLEKYEGGEVKMGALGAGVEKVVNIVTWAAGVEYNEDMIEYNQTWRISEIGVAFGEAYNKLLNELHLSPIIDGSYTTTGGGLTAQKAAQKAGTAQLIAFNTDIKTTLRDAISVLPAGTILLINSSDRFAIEDAIYGSLYADNATPSVVRRKLNPVNIVEYDGEEVEVGGKTYTYTGVTAGFCYLIVPKVNFKEYIKHDLRVDSNDGDLSRLIVSQVIGRARRGVLAGLSGKNGCIKVDIAA
jgi:hypothetical protein